MSNGLRHGSQPAAVNAWTNSTFHPEVPGPSHLQPHSIQSRCTGQRCKPVMQVTERSRPDAAAARNSKVAPGGPVPAVKRVAPFLEGYGTLLPALDAAYKAHAFKLTGNFMLFNFVQAMAEDSHWLREMALQGTMCWYLSMHSSLPHHYRAMLGAWLMRNLTLGGASKLT